MNRNRQRNIRVRINAQRIGELNEMGIQRIIVSALGIGEHIEEQFCTSDPYECAFRLKEVQRYAKKKGLCILLCRPAYMATGTDQKGALQALFVLIGTRRVIE